MTDAKGGRFTDPEAWFEFAGGPESFSLHAQNASRPTCRAWKCGSKRSPTPRKGDKSLNFVREEIIPSALKENNEGGGSSYQPVERYKITDLTGAIDGVDCQVSFTCAGVFQVVYEGRLDYQKNKYPRTMKPEYKPFVDELIELCIRRTSATATTIARRASPPHAHTHAPAGGGQRRRWLEAATPPLLRLRPPTPNSIDHTLRKDRRAPPGGALASPSPLRPLLLAGLLLQNIMQRMSGVATQTAVYVERLEGLVPRSSTRARPRPACACWTRWP